MLFYNFNDDINYGVNDIFDRDYQMSMLIITSSSEARPRVGATDHWGQYLFAIFYRSASS